jgi:hypothetical protein
MIKKDKNMETKTISEQIIYKITKRHFYDLYVFSNPKIKIELGEVELADVLVLIGNVIVSIQVKEKNKSGKIDNESWFQKKVIKEANKQHKNTLKYLLANTITFNNSNEEKIIQYEESRYKIMFMTIFRNEKMTEYKRYHKSSSLGEYPIFSIDDFSLICKDLLTPMDILSFVSFRIKLVKQYEKMSPRPLLIEVKFDDIHTGMVHDYSDANLITMFIIRSELIEKTAKLETTKRFMSYMDELLEIKTKTKDKFEMESINKILELYSKMNSKDVKVFYDFVDGVVQNPKNYGQMQFDKEIMIISNMIYYEYNNFNVLASDLIKNNIREFFWVIADEHNIGTSLMKI